MPLILPLLIIPTQVVLMSHSRRCRIFISAEILLTGHLVGLSQEASRLDIKNAKKLHTWSTCTCPPAVGCIARVPRCCCDQPDDISPLLQIRWKRLVVDEGNNLSNVNTGLFTFIKDISVECRWIVTGTPTSTPDNFLLCFIC